METIGWAVKQMHNGSCVRRSGWNGKEMFIFLVPGSTFEVNRAPLLGIYPAGTVLNYQPHVDMRTATGQIVPWLCSQSDLLATDWELAEQAEDSRRSPCCAGWECVVGAQGTPASAASPSLVDPS